LWAEEKCFDAETMDASGPLAAAALVFVFLLPQNNIEKNLAIDENKVFLFPLSPILLLIVMVLT
jgi:hypothetical protein